MTALPRYNVDKRIQYARAAMTDPVEERIFGWILHAVAYQEVFFAQEWIRGHEPNWKRYGGRLPRRFGPYLQWLGNQIKWWRRSFAAEVGDAWNEKMLDSGYRTYPYSVFRRDVLVSEHPSLSPWFEGESDHIADRPEEKLGDDAEGAMWIARSFVDITEWARSLNKDLHDYSLLQAYAASQAWLLNLGKKRHRISWFDRGRTLKQWPGGWSLQQLESDQISAEARAMQNCLEDFADRVDAEEIFMYSLRDPMNQPHVDIEWSAKEVDSWNDLSDSEARTLLGLEEGFVRDAIRDGILDLEGDHFVTWYFEGESATAFADGQEIGRELIDTSWRVREIRARDNEPPHKLSYYRMAVEGLLEEHGEALLASKDAWGELDIGIHRFGKDVVQKIIVEAGYDLPPWW